MLEDTPVDEDIKLTKKPTDGSNRTQYLISLPKNHRYFDGHFDDFSLLPGVAQIELVIRAMSLELHKNITIHSVRKTKFLKFIPPGVELDLALKMNSANETTWEMRLEADCVSKGTIKYA